KTKNKSIIIRVLEALSEPMLIILELAGVITLGVNIGKTLKNNSGDFYECIGIVFAILVSVILTVVMEGRSQKAFESLTDIYEKSAVKVTRNGSITILPQNQVVVGDIVHLESGDKIVADGRLISSINLEVDESLLTGESKEIRKDSSVILSEKTPLAERINMVYSGTFVTSGSGVMVVTAVGDNAEMGAIASDLKIKNPVSAPLQEKLDRLGKLIASLGLIASVFVLILSVTRLFVQGNVSFDSIEEAFLSSIILIVASVPEGLPTTVAISLTLNVVKLYKSNALIKKLIAAETVGCVSVICSDKTGTLTENKMRVLKVETQTNSLSLSKNLALNFALNTTAEIQNKEVGQATEIALLKYLNEGNLYSYNKLRKEYVVIGRTPFSSENKYMSTTVKVNGESITFFKGAPEIIIGNSTLTEKEKRTALKKILEEQLKGKRVIAFASSNKNQLNNLNYDGFAVIADAVRKDVFASVMECKSAGIKVKMLTGDNYSTAFSIAKELRIAESESEVVNASEIDELSDTELKDIISKITVVARSTPKTKLRIVNALKEMGEVVAVTGDGVNDAPAIKHADIGICMGGGSEVTKEASDIVLLDNSFSTIIKAISFGRNIYQNFQRFIMFQLSVNATAVSFIIISLILGLENPFNTIMLLWINLIMDGPPALTLGLETRGNELMKSSPVKRSNNIVTKKMLVKIAIHAGIMCTLLVLQNSINFIGCKDSEMKTVLFNLFILFQLFNAFNCREFGSKSVFKEIKSNKLMSIVFLVVFILQIMLTELATKFFCTVHLSLVTWIKTILTAFSIIA
ncbi:MAG: calcium-translocating P-type ATPase, PMCA-type, partial [Clostridia bacterium]|nr:calcium-translocating P-type ATPase, PMCA-type [Clostridia bacterium]